MSGPGALVHLAGAGARWLRFADPDEVVTATTVADVAPALRRVEAACDAGRWAVGFLAYEAAAAFDAAFAVHPPGELPLAWWALFRAPAATSAPSWAAAPPLAWRPAMDRDAHRRAVEAIRAAIARGDVYQVNLTFPLATPFLADADPAELFGALWAAQRRGYASLVDTGRFVVCSASPELFLHRDGDRVTTRPMKGTAARGRFPAEDAAAAAALAASAKERAENVMIVDMARNDLGRVARPGTVAVERLCEVETYPTVHQLVSTVTATTDAPLADVLAALFPAASITGAPKVAAMRRIRDLEPTPRGVYTGAVGVVGPGRRAQLAVAIRTAVVDRERGVAVYGTGGGITWDSDAAAEYEECRAKALVLTASRPPFALLETMRWRPRTGVFLRERHLARLAASARHLGFACDVAAIGRRLDELAATLPPARHRVRLRLGADGGVAVDAEPFPCAGRETWRVALAAGPVDSRDPALFHKTTDRARYDAARAGRPDCDDVVLWNERGELTEATRASLVLRIGGTLVTPPLDCGLLPGVHRAELLARGRLVERVLPRETLHEADAVFLVNALRGWIRARVVR